MLYNLLSSLCRIILKSRVYKKVRKKSTQGKNNVFADGFAIFLRELRFVCSHSGLVGKCIDTSH